MRYVLAAVAMAAVAMAAVLGMTVAGCSKSSPKGQGGGSSTAPSGSSATESSEAEAAKPPADTAGASKLAGEIRQGMTFDQVTAILGDPKGQWGAKDGDKDVLHCVWEKDGVAYTVQFIADKVVAVFHGTDSSAQPAVDAAQVKKNFSKVRVGMSEDEVEKLLGAPTNSGGVAGEGGMSMVTKTWEVDGATYAVQFVNGKVQIVIKDDGN